MTKNIIIDVGANYGGFSLEIAKRNPKTRVYAIEAEAQLAALLMKESVNIENHAVLNFAINSEEGDLDFYVSELGDHGTSSLLPFSKKHIRNDPYWKVREDLNHNRQTKVRALRLETLLNDIEFDEIDFIKIDVQGLDLAVLSSTGKFLHKIKAGMLEVPAVIEKSLYEGSEEDLLKALRFLSENGFKVYSIKPNDPASNEFNVFFVRNGIDVDEIENSLNLRNFHFYDGKNYWHVPSNKLEDPAQHIQNLQSVLCQEKITNSENNKKIEQIQNKLSVVNTRLNEILNSKIYRLLKFINLVK